VLQLFRKFHNLWRVFCYEVFSTLLMWCSGQIWYLQLMFPLDQLVWERFCTIAWKYWCGILWDFEQDLQAPYYHPGCIHGCVDIMLPHPQSSKMRHCHNTALSSQTCAASSLFHNCTEIGVHCTYSRRQHISCASFGKRNSCTFHHSLYF